MRRIEIRLDTAWLLIGSPGAFDLTMLNAADCLAGPAVIRMLQRDSRAMGRVRFELRRIYPALSASALRDQAIIDLLRRELHARRLIAIILRESKQGIAPADLADGSAGIVNLPLPDRTLLIARQGALPAEFLQNPPDNSPACEALSLLTPMSQPVALLEKQAKRLACVPAGMDGLALTQFVETRIGQGQLQAVALTDESLRMRAAMRSDAPRPVSSLDTVEKVAEAIRRSRNHLRGEVRRAVEEMIKPENLAMMAAVILAVALAQLTPITAALVDSTLLMLALANGGPGAVVAIADLVRATSTAMDADGEHDLDAAARLYAIAFIGLGAAVLEALMRRSLKVKGGKSEDDFQAKMNAGAEGKPATPQPKPSTSSASAPPPKPKPEAKSPDPVPPKVAPNRLPFHRQDLADEWYDPKTGGLRWPPDDGFAPGSRTPDVLKPGYVMDRYGGPLGNFTAPPGTPFAERALPYDVSKMPYKQYEVLRDLPVESGKIAPWFGDPGGGTQYKTPMTIQEMLDAVPPYIKDVTP